MSDIKTPESTPVDPDQTIIQISAVYKSEAKEAKQDRMKKNTINWDTFNLRGDFSHKKSGQSKEFLPSMSMGVEQVASFLHQAMVDSSPWFKIDAEDGIDPKTALIKPEEMTKLTERQLDKIKFPLIVEDGIKSGVVGSIIIAKVYGEYVDRPEFRVKKKMTFTGIKKTLEKVEKKAWQLRVKIIRQEDWYPDPTGRKLYFCEEMEMDYAQVLDMAKGENAIYNLEEVKKLVPGVSDSDQDNKKARETAQNLTTHNRKRVKIQEWWGDILDTTTGEVLHKNVVWTIANDQFLIQKPTQNPFWHNKRPYITVPILRNPNPGEWTKALADAPTALNLAKNELFNLMLDSGMMATYGIRQLHTSWLVDETKIAEGIPPGTTLEVNDQCPPGAKVMEACQTGEMSSEATQLFNIVGSELNQSMMTNDLRMGQMPARQVKATEVVEASQTITSMFTGLAKIVEDSFVEEVLHLAWMTIAQNMDDMDDREIESLFGKERAQQLAAIQPAERFHATVEGYQFKVFGISQTLSKMKDFKKAQMVLQTISSSEVLMEEFAKKYDFGKFLDFMMRSLDINTDQIQLSEADQLAMKMGAGGAGGGGPMAPGATQPGTQPNAQSQIAQAGAAPENKGPGSRFPQPKGTAAAGALIG